MRAKKVVILIMVSAVLALVFKFAWAMQEENALEEAAIARNQAEQVKQKAAQEKWNAEHPKEAEAAAKAQAEAQRAAQEEAVKKQTQRLLAAHGAVELKHAMKDPDSFKLLSVLLMQDGSACYDYSATNTFGGRMKEYAVLTPKGKILINQPDVFNKFCANKSGQQLVASAE